MPRLPDLSRLELQCLKQLSALGDASVRGLHRSLTDPPSYSTVRKIVERLEEKGAVSRVRRDGKAWIYRAVVSGTAMVGKEIRRLLDSLFDGKARPLVHQLADMEALSLEDLREVERRLVRSKTGRASAPEKKSRGRKTRR